MKKETSYKIEALLDRAGAADPYGDVRHRYKLRRTLLCSKYFDAAGHHDARRNRFLVYTAPLFAGTILVVVFSFALTAMTQTDASFEPHPTIDTSHIVSAERLSQITFVAAKPSPQVDVLEYVDTTHPLVPLSDFRFVPIRSYDNAMVR